MLRLFVDDKLSGAQKVRTSKEHKHYLEKVMRSSEADILLFNNKDGEFLARYAGGQFRVVEQTRTFQPLPKKALAFGLIKSHRLSWLIEKSCELGATDLFPLITERVQFSAFKVERYERILIEAAEQCGRIDLPLLHDVRSLTDFADALPPGYDWHFGSLSVETASSPGRHGSASAYIIGPEGGLTQKEEQILTNANATPFSMGSLTLRAETAGLWCLSQSMPLYSAS
jgi:16S rRNA (uracil1498-N3)-methyltransferase